MARLLTASVSLPGGLYPDEADRAEFWERTFARLAALPGVEARARRQPAARGRRANATTSSSKIGRRRPGRISRISIWVGASPGFFKAVGLRLERGRLLDDAVAAERRASSSTARGLSGSFPGEEVVGRRLHEGGCTTCPWTTVVGVVGTVKFAGLDAPGRGTVYCPFVDLPNGYVVLRTPRRSGVTRTAVASGHARARSEPRASRTSRRVTNWCRRR